MRLALRLLSIALTLAANIYAAPRDEETCQLLRTSSGVTVNMSGSATIDSNTLNYIQRTVAGSRPGDLEVMYEFTFNGAQILQVKRTATSKAVTTQAVISPQRGARLKPVTVQLIKDIQSRQITGSIQGKRIATFDAREHIATNARAISKLTPADGSPNPLTSASIPDRAILEPLMHALQPSLDKCGARISKSIIASMGPGVSEFEFAPAESGHDSHMNTDASCLACKFGKCEAKLAACVAGGIGELISLIFDDEECVEKYWGCVSDCQQPGNDCCPVKCDPTPQDIGFGLTAFFGYCDSDESCLNTNGVCCSAGTIPCGGKQCCTDSEKCNPTSGKCGIGTICGNGFCNDDTEVCMNGACCKKENKCGTACCDELENCANQKTGLCCSIFQDVCLGQCCPSGERCVTPAQGHLGFAHCCARPCGEHVCCPEGQTCLDPNKGTCTSVSCQQGFSACVSQPSEGGAPTTVCCPNGVTCCNGQCCGTKSEICCGPGGTCQDVNICIK